MHQAHRCWISEQGETTHPRLGFAFCFKNDTCSNLVFFRLSLVHIPNVNRIGFGVVLVFHIAPSRPATCYSCWSALSILGSRFKSRRQAESQLSWSESSEPHRNAFQTNGAWLVFQDPKHPETGDPNCRACCYWIRMRQRSTTCKTLQF